DPYWGEKIAGHYYRLDKALGSKDYNYYQLGIKKNDEAIPVNLDLEGDLAYLTSNQQRNIGVSNYPVLVLEQLNNRLKVQSDLPISNQRVVAFDTQYDFGLSEAYVSSDEFMLLNEGEMHNPDDVIKYLTVSVEDEVSLSQLLNISELELATLEFKSSNESVAVIEQGKVVAKSSGITRISTLNNEEISFDVRVMIPVEKLDIKTKIKSVKVGKKLKLDYELLPKEASNQNVLWISSDEKIAKVSQDGLVTGLSEGEVTITILSDEGGVMDEQKIKVTS
ncbi:MAG: Ig-like domain-containing protein, partial [Turicibacter sp.]|nr:Ig-like domain-containing protein [Turicibacter sp.]